MPIGGAVIGEKNSPIDLHSFYISGTAGPIDTKFGSYLPPGALMTPDKFCEIQPKGGAIMEAGMPKMSH